MTSSGTGLDEGISNPASAALQYEVFLSFRGKDTRCNFTSHLYAKLIESGIGVYKDNKELRIGEEIGPGLRQGIEQSKIAIPILSKGYAESRWCLDELVLIMKRRRQGSLNVKPIFYDVKPSQVREQTGSYEEAFELHRKNHDDKTISEWKGALGEVAQLKGWESDPKIEEGDLVKEITREVLHELKKDYLYVNEDVLVGLEDNVDEILSLIKAERSSVGVLGIYGMGGIGKTTLAKVIYNHLLPRFDSRSFVEDVRENYKTNGKQFLLKKLISDILSKESADNMGTGEGFHIIRERFCDRKVLILLDDVDNIVQIEGLMEESKLFALESIIIITTRDKGILRKFEEYWLYELPVMHHKHARKLFIKCAFQNDNPPEDYGELIEKAVEISGRLPFCVKIIGSSLCGQNKEEWEWTLKKLERVPHDEVKKSLRISFETLDKRQQQILLDIACFLIGVDSKMAIHFWHGLNLHPDEAIQVLRQRSLIKIGADNIIRMHDQMRDFCRDYIEEDQIGKPERQRILWNQEEAAGKLMGEGEEAKSIEGLFLQFDMQSQGLCTAENFAKLPNLKFLQVKSNDISQAISLFGRGLRTIARLFSLLRGNPPTLSKLRWLYWHHFPPTYELSIFSFQNLLFLDLSESCITDGWDRRSHIKIANRLKVLNLCGCKKLTKTLNFPANLPLEQLILEGCSSLIDIDSSIRLLKELRIINLRGCRSLRKLPTGFGDIKSLVELILDDTSLSEFPESIDLGKLSLLSLRNMSSIRALPKSTTGFKSLVQLELSYSGIVELPDSIGNMTNLERLNVDGCNIRELPTSLDKLKSLEVISADECRHLESIPNLPDSLISLTVCSEARMKRIPDFSNLNRLKHLIASFDDVPCDPPEAEIIWNIGKLSELVHVKVRLPHIQILHGELGEFSHLKELVLEKCHGLRSIPKLPSRLMMLRVDDCWLLKSLPDLSHLKRLRDLHIGCPSIHKVEGLQMLKKLRKLVFDRCDILQGLPDMSNLKKLKILEVKSCLSLVEIKGRSLESLEELDMWDCISLKKMPDIPNKETMKKCRIVNCGKFSSVEVKEEDPVVKELKKAGDYFDLMEMIQKIIADVYLSKKELFESNSIITPLFLLLVVLTLLAPKFFGLEPYRLSWLGIFLYLILLFICS